MCLSVCLSVRSASIARLSAASVSAAKVMRCTQCSLFFVCFIVFDTSGAGGVDSQDTGGSGAQLESQLLIRHVTPDSFRTFTIVAENEVSTARRDIRLLTRG